jgi:hypothetical protein
MRTALARPKPPAFRVEIPLYGRVSGLTLPEAEELLDWLKGAGYQSCNVTFDAGRGLTVQYRE